MSNIQKDMIEKLNMEIRKQNITLPLDWQKEITLEEGLRTQIYEVSQSVLFLIQGLLKDKLEVVYKIFPEMLLQVGVRDNKDEILELLADIWKQFLNLGLNDYYNKVYDIAMMQLQKQDDISFAGKSIFQFLSQLFEAGFNKQLKLQEEVEKLKMFFFHRIVEVKEAFYINLWAFAKESIKKYEDPCTLNFMKVVFQNGVFEEKLETLFLSLISCDLLMEQIQTSQYVGLKQK